MKIHVLIFFASCFADRGSEVWWYGMAPLGWSLSPAVSIPAPSPVLVPPPVHRCELVCKDGSVCGATFNHKLGLVNHMRRKKGGEHGVMSTVRFWYSAISVSSVVLWWF